MPGQRPSRGRKLIIESFFGVNQVYDEVIIPHGITGWVYGLIDTEEQKLARLGGKLPLAASNETLESVISIGQVQFATSSYIITQCASTRRLHDLEDSSVVDFDGVSEYGL